MSVQILDTTDTLAIEPIKYKGKVVITTEQLAQSYETDSHNIQMNFSRNKDKFIEDKHYHLLIGDELKLFKSQPTNSDVVNKFCSQLYL